MSETKQLEGGRLWTAKTRGLPGWQSDDGHFDILQKTPGEARCVLVSFIHDPVPGDDAEFWRKQFHGKSAVEDAMKYVETM